MFQAFCRASSCSYRNAFRCFSHNRIPSMNDASLGKRSAMIVVRLQHHNLDPNRRYSLEWCYGTVRFPFRFLLCDTDCHRPSCQSDTILPPTNQSSRESIEKKTRIIFLTGTSLTHNESSVFSYSMRVPKSGSYVPRPDNVGRIGTSIEEKQHYLLVRYCTYRTVRTVVTSFRTRRRHVCFSTEA